MPRGGERWDGFGDWDWHIYTIDIMNDIERIRLPMQEKQEMLVQPPGQEDPPEEEMAPYSTVPAWKIPRTEEPAGL